MPDDQDQIQEVKKKKKDGEAKLAFEIGAVFTPENAKTEDLHVDLEAARYRATHGQGGDRKANDGPNDYVHEDVKI